MLASRLRCGAFSATADALEQAAHSSVLSRTAGQTHKIVPIAHM